MATHKRRATRPPAPPAAVSPSTAPPRHVTGPRATLAILTLLVAAVGIALGPGGGTARYCLSAAAARTAADEWTAARRWLDRAARFAPGDPRVALGKAAIARRQGHADLWARHLDAARAAGADPAALERERSLAALWSGADAEGAERRITTLASAGVPAAEIAAGAVVGSLTRGDWRRADHLLAAVAAGLDDPLLVDLLTARVRDAAGDRSGAETLLRSLLARRPANDAAHEALVESLAGAGRIDDALAAARAWVATAPDDPTARVTLSRILRQAGRHDDAGSWIVTAAGSKSAGATDAPALFTRERAEVALEAGDARAALRLIDALPVPPGRRVGEAWESRATALALAGDPTVADLLFRARDAERSGTAAPQPAADDPSTPHGFAQQCFTRHCAACHGDGREPRGRAAADLFPPPRDFRHDAFRLVSTPDGEPSTADIAAVIQRGIPGTSMVGFPDLSAAEVDALVAAVLAARSPRAAAGRPPAILPTASDLQAGDPDRGRGEYRAAGCATCHGPEGSPTAPPRLFDERGVPNPPRDLVHDPFKGGRSPEAVAARLALGMPGSAHPAISLPPDQLADLVAWVVSLAGPERPRRTNHERLLEADPVATAR
jgi:mono/diheme cytochrome c family protein